MAQLLLNLYRAADDEAEDVRRLLDDHHIEWYETTPSPWGISHGGIWVKHDQDMDQALQLLHAYESDRSARVRAELAAQRAAGTAPTFWSELRHRPMAMIAALLAVAFALALIGLPIWLLHP